MRHGIYVLAMIGTVPAAAQETPTQDSKSSPDQATSQASAAEPRRDPQTQVFKGDYIIVGVGLGSFNSYDGSDDRRLMPVAGAMGRVGGRNFRIRGPNVSVDLLRHTPDQHLRFRLSPTLRYGGNRTGNIEDPVVKQLGKLESGFEGGVSVGARYRRFLNPYDSLSIGASVRWDLSGRHGGAAYGAQMSYTTPLSPAFVMGAQISASFVSSKNADYNFSVTPEGSAASGLPVYKAKGGLKELSVGAFTAYDLTGDFRDGGFMIGIGAQYGRLQGSAAESPITSIRGTPNQWVAGGGLAYGF